MSFFLAFPSWLPRHCRADDRVAVRRTAGAGFRGGDPARRTPLGTLSSQGGGGGMVSEGFGPSPLYLNIIIIVLHG